MGFSVREPVSLLGSDDGPSACLTHFFFEGGGGTTFQGNEAHPQKLSDSTQGSASRCDMPSK